jgi:hypothetical protein
MPKRPRDPAQLAKLIVDIATGEVEDSKGPATSPAERGRKGGLKGGKARAAAMSPEEKLASAKKAAAARWNR